MKFSIDMKKIGIVVGVSLMSITGAFAASLDTYIGPNNNLHATYFTGTNIKGDYITVSLEGYVNEKQVYARMGDVGGYSDWVKSTVLKCSRTDYGAFGDIGKSHWGYIWDYR